MVVPNNHGVSGFPTFKNDHFGMFWGYHHLRKHPSTNHTKKKHIKKDMLLLLIVQKSS